METDDGTDKFLDWRIQIANTRIGKYRAKNILIRDGFCLSYRKLPTKNLCYSTQKVLILKFVNTNDSRAGDCDQKEYKVAPVMDLIHIGSPPILKTMFATKVVKEIWKKKRQSRELVSCSWSG